MLNILAEEQLCNMLGHSLFGNTIFSASISKSNFNAKNVWGKKTKQKQLPIVDKY